MPPKLISSRFLHEFLHSYNYIAMTITITYFFSKSKVNCPRHFSELRSTYSSLFIICVSLLTIFNYLASVSVALQRLWSPWRGTPSKGCRNIAQIFGSSPTWQTAISLEGRGAEIPCLLRFPLGRLPFHSH